MNKIIKNSRGNQLKNISIIISPFCFISLIPNLLNIVNRNNLYSITLQVGIQSFVAFILGVYLIYISFYLYKTENKRTNICVILGLAFCIFHNLCYFICMMTDFRVAVLYVFTRHGDTKVGFTLIGFYSILLIIKKLITENEKV